MEPLEYDFSFRGKGHLIREGSSPLDAPKTQIEECNSMPTIATRLVSNHRESRKPEERLDTFQDQSLFHPRRFVKHMPGFIGELFCRLIPCPDFAQQTTLGVGSTFILSDQVDQSSVDSVRCDNIIRPVKRGEGLWKRCNVLGLQFVLTSKDLFT